MRDNWLFSARVGIVLGVIMAVLLFVPAMVWQSRRFGRLTLGRTLAAAAFAVYGVTLAAYTLLPLPPEGFCEAGGGHGIRVRPFHSVGDIVERTAHLSLAGALRSYVVLQVVLNVALFVPWGVFVRRLFGRSWWFAGLSGAAVSFVIEATQGTGLWGIYGCAYRYADIDDVITNTTGALIGALIAPVLLAWVPEARPDVERRREPRPVTRRRRLAGMLIDVAAIYGLWVSLLIGERVASFEVERLEGVGPEALRPLVLGLVATAVVVGFPTLIGSGASLGQRAMWLQPAREADGRRPARLRVIARTCFGVVPYALLAVAQTVPRWLSEAVWFRNFALAWIAVSIVAVLVDRSARGVSFRIVGLGLADSRDRPAPPSADRADPADGAAPAVLPSR